MLNPNLPLRAIGLIHTPHRELDSTPIQPCFAENIQGEAEVDLELSEGLEGLSDFSHAFLIYQLHKAAFQGPKVTPFLTDEPKGVFACRHPQRPNGLGLSLVRLLSVEGNRVRFSGADMLDGSPLLDIKPYYPKADRPEAAWGGWTEHLDPRDAELRGRRERIS